jgi:uncharacterized protein
MIRGRRERGRTSWDWRAKVCVITGSSSGIGARLARDLARLDARVCVVARREGRLTQLLSEMGGQDAGHSLFVADVSSRDDVAALGRHVAETFGRCDVLVNNAGVGGERAFDAEGALDDLQRVMGTNFFGAAHCTGELLELLVASAPSAVVNVASMAGRLTWGGASAYCASKFALVGWSESLFYELAYKGVHVGIVEPGPLPTEGFPQRGLIDDPVLKHTLTTDAEVATAIREVIEARKLERVVPRYYYLLQLPRVLTPPLYRFAQRRVLARAGRPQDRNR